MLYPFSEWVWRRLALQLLYARFSLVAVSFWFVDVARGWYAACLQKADKEHLDAKVNCSHFEATRDELNSMINISVDKLLGTVCWLHFCTLHTSHFYLCHLSQFLPLSSPDEFFVTSAKRLCFCFGWLVWLSAELFNEICERCSVGLGSGQ